MRKLYTYSILIMLFFRFSQLMSQDHFLMQGELKFKHLDIHNGLSQGSIRSIYQDSRGFLWFGTHDGLNRYDGSNFKIYRNESGDRSSISNNWIYCITEDSEGNLWIGTADGFNKYDPHSEKFMRFRLSDYNKKLNNTIYAISANKTEKGFIYLGTVNGLIKYDIRGRNIKNYKPSPETPIISDTYIRTLYQTDDGYLWIGHTKDGLIRFDPKTETLLSVMKTNHNKNALKEYFVSSIISDKNNNLWMATFNGLYKYNKISGKIIEYRNSNYLINSTAYKYTTSLVLDDYGKIWIGTIGSGIAVFDTLSKKFTNIIEDARDPNSISLPSILSLYKDKSGQIWVGTTGSGIDIYNPYSNAFAHIYQNKMNFSMKSVRCFYEDNYGKIWVGGYKSGIDIFDPKTKKFTNIQYLSVSDNNSTPNLAYTFVKDALNRDKVWVGTEGDGIFYADSKTLTFSNFSKELSRYNTGYYVNAIYSDIDGTIWMGSPKGLSHFNRDNKQLEYFAYNSKDSNSIGFKFLTCIYKDKQNNLWVGTDLSGLYLYNPKSKNFKRFVHDDFDDHSIGNNFIRTIFEDSKNRLWVGTNGGGLNLLNRKTQQFKRITTKNGLPNNVIYGILEDSKENLWISTNMGLSKYNPGKNTFKNYDVEDGLQGNEFNQNAYYKTKSGMMLFGGTNGFTAFYPENLHINNNKPDIVLTDLKIFNKSVQINAYKNGREILKESITLTNKIKLDYTDNVFTIEFAALDYVLPGKNKYKYKLEGFDKDWILTSLKAVTYTNLDPGTYIFKVNGSNNDGIWNDKGKELIIVIEPPLWRTNAFYIFALLFAIGLVYAIYKIRIRNIRKTNIKLEKTVEERTAELAELNNELQISEKQLLELNQTKDKFFSIIAHDLRNPMSVLMSSTDFLSKSVDLMTQSEIIDLISDLNKTSKSLYDLLENLLTWARSQSGKIDYNPEEFDLSELATAVVYTLGINAENKNIELKSDISQFTFVKADYNMISTVLRNLVSNAIKFTSEFGKIHISAKVKNEENKKMTEISISDSGIGISQKDLQKLFKLDTAHTTIGTGQEKGTGLGLILCKEFVEKHGGSIKAESQEGKGTVFIFSLPSI